jgi:cobalt-zinc-cadmium efflux system membrane fusion protein
MILLASCNTATKTNEVVTETNHLIEITQQQFETDGMVLGSVMQMPFEEVTSCHGTIEAKSNGIASISSLVPGVVQRIYYTAGQFVKKGSVLFDISGNELIDLQREFSETASRLKRLKSEFDRTQTLFNENVGTEKEFISAESEYKMAAAKYTALKMMLTNIGLDVSVIEKGDFYSSYAIKSPLNGYLTIINIKTGQYTNPNVEMAEIVDVGQLQLKLAVFEKDINNLQIGQKVKFKLSGNPGEMHQAILASVGRTVSPESKTIYCYANIDDLDNVNFVNNAFIEAQITSKVDTINAIPEGALIKSEGQNYILALEKTENDMYYLNSVKVTTGRTFNGYVELVDGNDLDKIITQGAYNISIE